MTPVHGRPGGTAAVALAACLFGTLGPTSRVAYEAGLTPLAFVFWRAAIGTLALAALLGFLHARGRGRVRWLALPPRALAALALAGGTSLVLNLAISRPSSARASPWRSSASTRTPRWSRAPRWRWARSA